MDDYDKRDELEDMISGLDSIIDDLTDRYYIDGLREFKYEAEKELEEVQERINIIEEKENQEQESQYWASQF